jgi:lipopolysaccharide heptosyltransferase I
MPRRFLIIRLSAIGDVINTLPSVSLLRRHAADSQIVFAVEDRAKDVVVGHPDVNQVVVFPRKRWKTMIRSFDLRVLGEFFRYVRRIRSFGFEIALDFQGNLKGALHSFFSGAPRRIGFAKGHVYEGNHLFSTERVVPDRPHRVEKFASLLRPVGIEPKDLRYRLPPIPPFKHPRTYAVIHPGTSDHGPEKRWPKERFAELARRLNRELELDVIVTWGPGERELAESVSAILAPATRSLMELAGIIQGARLFVSADTGPMHLAAACGTPCIALFGPKDPAVYRPYGEGHTVIYRPEGMAQITVDEVFKAAAEKLGAAVKV